MARFPEVGDDPVCALADTGGEGGGGRPERGRRLGSAAEDPALTPLGVRDQFERLVQRDVAPRLRDIQEALELMTAQQGRFMQGVALKQPDPTDAAAAGIRTGIRAAVRGMSPASRMQLLTVEADVIVLQALAEVPNFLTALTAQEQGLVEELRLEAALAEHPETRSSSPGSRARGRCSASSPLVFKSYRDGDSAER